MISQKGQVIFMEYQHIVHPFSPVFDAQSETLVLGTLPSVKSRENDFYYGHPQNRFWKLLAALFREPVPVTAAEKTALLLRNHIALWDVIAACDIRGSSDSSIRNVVPADLQRILAAAPIRCICANGAKAGQLYTRYQLPNTGVPITVLPSTSPANAACNMEKLIEKWSILRAD